MSQYPTAAPHLLQSIFEILREDETHFNDLMRNFLWINLSLICKTTARILIAKAIIAANWFNHLKMLFILICHGYEETTQIRKSGSSAVLYIDGLFKFKPCLPAHSNTEMWFHSRQIEKRYGKQLNSVKTLDTLYKHRLLMLGSFSIFFEWRDITSGNVQKATKWTLHKLFRLELSISTKPCQFFFLDHSNKVCYFVNPNFSEKKSFWVQLRTWRCQR